MHGDLHQKVCEDPDERVRSSAIDALKRQHAEEEVLGPSLDQVGSLKSSFPAMRYAMLIRFFVVLYPRALRLAA